ncbi:hypothetical protein [Lacinutrix sp. Hel_I_90]|uniref:hypothetical protein n=1 Tax=Lacinutrix sp. Hel_I_90 TaxID=1249999 RepID=UPI0005C995DC|nr:hypothetical protein [Lacinutrix sp. Hel_I_90]
MKTTTSKIRIELVLCFLVTFITQTLCAQNFSGLQNKDLNKIDDVTGVLSDILSNFNGKIDKATVTYDSERTLKVTVHFSGTQDGYFIANVLAGDKTSQREISKIEYSLEGKSSPLELEFFLSENATEGTALSSAYLEIKLSESKNKFVKKTFLYALNKNWKKDISPENLIIPITLEPIGSAANLKENIKTIVLPIKKPVLKYDRSKIKNVALYKPSRAVTNVRTLKAETPTSTNTSTIDGTWENTDKNTRSITKIIISNNGTKIQAFGKCSPKDCDWGTTRLSSSRGTYYATFKLSNGTSSFNFSIKDNVMSNTHTKVYKLASKPKKTTNSTFKKQITPLLAAVYYPSLTTTSTTATTETTPPADMQAQGPDNQAISLWEDLVADNDFEFPHEITNIRMDIYPDKNKASGIFYYLPTAYHLRWNKDEGYNFKMTYGTADNAESTGDVRMTGTLTPGITSNEVALMKSLLESYVKDNPLYTYKELKIMPLQSVPAISISAGLEGHYNIPANKINVSVSSSITNPIDISWVTDSNTKEEMQVSLAQSIGINGEMTLVPDSETVPSQLIPVRITISDPRTIGRFTLTPNQWRNENWVNTTDFPLRLKKIHALIIEKQGNKSIPLIYSWDLNDTEVPSKASVNFNTSKMPSWIETENKTERIWIDYNIVDCTSCVNKVIDNLIDGTISKEKNISFESFKIFDATNAAFLKIRVRAIQADPKKERLIELPPVRVTEDLSVFSTGPLYLSDEEAPSFEYYLSVVMDDGVVYDAADWIPASDVEVFIGMQNLKAAIPELNTLITED